MTTRSSAKRYARALLDVAFREADPDRVEQDLAAFVELLEREPAIGRALLGRTVPPPRKRDAVGAIVERAGLVAPVSKLLVLLAERDQLALLPDLRTAYREQLLERRGIVRAEVTTAGPLAEDRAGAIERRLAAVTGRRVSMVARVDPRIIGGVVARVGSTVYDGSIATHLKRIRARLVEGIGPGR